MNGKSVYEDKSVYQQENKVESWTITTQGAPTIPDIPASGGTSQSPNTSGWSLREEINYTSGGTPEVNTSQFSFSSTSSLQGSDLKTTVKSRTKLGLCFNHSHR